MTSGLRSVTAAVLIAAALAACQESAATGTARVERPVLVQTVRLEPQLPERTFVASIRPRVESDLGFRVAGKVARRLVNVGDAVRAGQALAVLDETDLRLQRERDEAECRAAAAALVQADADLRRLGTLNGKGWSTDANLDRQKAAVEEARSRLARAERALALSENALSYAALTADADGVVTAALVEPGQVVAPGQTAIRLAQLSEKEAAVAIPEAQVGEVRDGVASLSLWSEPGRRYEARLRELSPSADPTTRTYLARFAIPQAGTEVQLGMTATVRLTARAAPLLARLPLSALFSQGDGPAVWVVETEGRLTLRPVTVAAYEARDVLVADGLKDGDQVVTLGVQKLDPGQRVRVVQASAL